ncbi:Benzoate 4-monooxygenase cytochrome P450 protein [Rutstroemia sp. NJR-2017a WRK4]|nr:Benzoate 4-monooxygenase cytochrome P450 protein [Rutstroemia sp. NJR-2017a WRK4]
MSSIALFEKAISQNVLLVSFGSFIFYYIASAIYNLYFSPLSKYPGPFLAKISAWPNFYYASTGYRHIWIWQCHEKYGDAFRYKPNGVLFNSPSSYRTIYQSRANVKKGKFYEMWPRNLNAPNTLGTVDKLMHARKRRVLNHAFSPEAIRSAENFVIQHVDRWNEILIDGNDGRDWTEPVNISEMIDYLVHDILGDLCFGRSLDLKEPGENQFRHIPHSIGLDTLLDKTRPEEIRQYHDFLESSVAQRTKEEEASKNAADGTSQGRKDIFHYLFNAKNETGQPAYTNGELLEEAGLIVIAGTDTTANALSGFWFYITRSPRVYSKLVEEIRTTFQSADDIKMGPTLSSCKYLHATIDETLRCCPSLPSDLPREVLPGGLSIEGHHLPAGTQVGVGGWAIMHKQEIFSDPWTFRPERWIVDPEAGVTADDVARAQSAFNPFMIGAGNCAGQKVAMEELLITTARTLYRMEVRLAEGDTLGAGKPELGWGMRDRKTILLRDAFTAVRDGPRLQFRRRV